MDWNRAKTILIISFLVLDLVLGYQLWNSNMEEMEGSDLTEGSIEAFDKLLSEHNIEVAVEVPSSVPTLAALNVKYKMFTPEDFQANDRNKRQEPMQLQNGFSARFNPPIPFSSIDEAKEKLKTEAFNFDQYQSVDSETNTKKLVFVQQRNGYPLFDAKINVSIYKNEMIDYNQSYYEVISEAAEGKRVISGFAALRTLVEGGHLPEYEKINDINLGYYGQLFSSEQQVLTPVWRIKVQSGVMYDVNAFTGSIEKTTIRN